MIKILSVIMFVNFLFWSFFSESVRAEGNILPSISVVMYGDLEAVAGLKEQLLENFGNGEHCKTTLKDEGGDFELIIEGNEFKREVFFLGYTLIQPFKNSAVFKIYNFKGSLESEAKEEYVDNSRIYLNSWTSISTGRTAEVLAKKICQDYYDNLEGRVLESLRD